MGWTWTNQASNANSVSCKASAWRKHPAALLRRRWRGGALPAACSLPFPPGGMALSTRCPSPSCPRVVKPSQRGQFPPGSSRNPRSANSTRNCPKSAVWSNRSGAWAQNARKRAKSCSSAMEYASLITHCCSRKRVTAQEKRVSSSVCIAASLLWPFPRPTPWGVDRGKRIPEQQPLRPVSRPASGIRSTPRCT
jgi:hypothetical protein